MRLGACYDEKKHIEIIRYIMLRKVPETQPLFLLPDQEHRVLTPISMPFKISFQQKDRRFHLTMPAVDGVQVRILREPSKT